MLKAALSNQSETMFFNSQHCNVLIPTKSLIHNRPGIFIYSLVYLVGLSEA